MTDLRIKVDSKSWVTRDADPNDDWDYGDEDGSYDVLGVSLSSEGWQIEFFQSSEEIAPGDTVYVVWADYGSGSTFGTSGGHGSIILVTKKDDLAMAAKRWAESNGSAAYPWPTEAGREPYASGDGYFERLNAIKTDVFTVGI